MKSRLVRASVGSQVIATGANLNGIEALHLLDDVSGAAGEALVAPYGRDGTECALVGTAAAGHHAVPFVSLQVHPMVVREGDGIEIGNPVTIRGYTRAIPVRISRHLYWLVRNGLLLPIRGRVWPRRRRIRPDAVRNRKGTWRSRLLFPESVTITWV